MRVRARVCVCVCVRVFLLAYMYKNLHQLCVDTGYSLVDLSGGMDDWDSRRKKHELKKSVLSARLDDDDTYI